MLILISFYLYMTFLTIIIYYILNNKNIFYLMK